MITKRYRKIVKLRRMSVILLVSYINDPGLKNCENVLHPNRYCNKKRDTKKYYKLRVSFIYDGK